MRAAKEAQSDPSKAQELAAQGQDLAQKAAALSADAANLTKADAERLAECSEQATKALQPAG